MIEELKLFSKNEGKKENNDEFINDLSKSKFKQIFIKDYNNKNRKGLKKYYNYKQFIILIFFFLTYLLFLLSLEKCYLGIDLCPGRFDWMKLKVIELIISCIILSILIEFMIYGIISRINIIHVIIIFFSFYEYSHGLDFDNHGLFNLIGYFVLLFIILLLFIPFNIFIWIVKKRNKILLIIYIIILFLSMIIFVILYKINIFNCDDWPRGLNNSFIDNNKSKYGCQIVFPKRCPYKIFYKFQDFTKIFGKNCESYRLFGGKEKLLANSKSPFLNSKANRIGYPLTNKNSSCFLDMIGNHNYVQEYFLNNLVDMDNENILRNFYKDKFPEVEVDFTNNSQGRIKINLNYNQTLSENRILLEKNTKPYSNNIIVLYIDSVSRSNSLRTLKKTAKFFEQFMPFKGGFNKKYPSENFHSFQFFKYHSFRFHTSFNFPILFYGQQRDLNKVLITKYLKENGYITGYTGDYCYKDNIRIHNNWSLNEVYDHQFLICDPNNDHYNLYTLNCLYGKPTSQHLFEYGFQFWRKYKNNRKFLAIITNDGHEGTFEVLKYIDKIIYNFLNELYNENLLKDSAIFLLSDHGLGMPSLYYLYNFYSIEENLPMLYILVNDRKNLTYEQQYKYIHENQQTFITGFDIYNTFGNIIFGDDYKSIKNKTLENDTVKSEFGISLFDKINQKKRYPKIYQFSSGINNKYCI